MTPKFNAACVIGSVMVLPVHGGNNQRIGDGAGGRIKIIDYNRPPSFGSQRDHLKVSTWKWSGIMNALKQVSAEA